jgi:hypothetical protein
MNKISFLISFLIFSLSLTVGCAPKANLHIQEAAALCDVYNPDNWKDFSQKQEVSYSELLSELANRISQVIVTPEFRNIFKELSETSYSPDMNVYTFYQERISKLTGTEWNCPFAKDFYSVEWKSEPSTPESRIRLEQKGDDAKNSGNEVVVWIDKDGNYYIDSDDTGILDTSSLKDALSKQPYQKVIIRADGETQFQNVVSLMDIAQSLRIPDVSIETKSE